MSQTTDARPSQVTLAGWMITSGSVLLVVSLFTTMSSLRSLDTRRSVEETLAEPPLDTSGISVEGFLQLLHASALVAGGCAAAMAVLGVYALRRHRGARVVLSVLAVPLFVAGIVAGGLLSSVVAASVVLLWLKPSRDWFSHVPREVPEAPDRPAGQDQQDQQRTSDAPPPVDAPWSRPVVGGEATGARPYTGYGTAEGRPGPPSGPQTDTLPRPWGAPPPAASPRGDARSRPGAVLAACLVTWVLSSLVVALMLVGVAQAFLSADLLFDEVRAQQPQALEESGLTPGALATTMAVMCGLLALWALGAILAAVLAFRGSPAGRTTLVVSTAVTGVLALGAGFVQPVFWLLAIGAALVLVCLLRPEVRAWYAGRGGMGR